MDPLTVIILAGIVCHRAEHKGRVGEIKVRLTWSIFRTEVSKGKQDQMGAGRQIKEASGTGKDGIDQSG